MTDGWNWRRPDSGAAQPTSATPASAAPGRPPPAAGPGASPWWSDARNDPWRDPYAPAAVVVQPVAVTVGAPEPVEDPALPRRRGLGLVLVVAVVTALLAGGLGSALGFMVATHTGFSSGTQIGAGPQSPGAPMNERPPDSLAGVAKKLTPSVVTVRVPSRGGTSVGSGFVVTADGYVITNDHVVAGGIGGITATFADGTVVPGSLVGKEPESDIAVIKLSKGGLTPVQIGDSEQVAVGDPVLAFGSPLALSNTVTAGIVSALDRTIQSGEGGQTRYYAAIQTDAAVNQGNSGGPLVDGAGRVIGVNSVIKSIAQSDEAAGNIGLAFAIPINQAKRVAQDIIDTGRARRTVIGAQVGGVAGTGGGVRLSSVQPDGPADRAGLRSGDVVTRLAGHVLEEPGDLIALVRKYAPNSVVSVEYRRGSSRQTASVTLTADAK
ncbi:S1C family serine protease [Rhizomonospora bruguierae]|uniref:S1C family serine protease n=1 Tax=Rhizomonospora bruguierae TaxID=1581705 RepID=UPI0020BE8350|nr:trypsin-like peptidase domain-containing protein [Micromonospora sp. NBRC 107566]